MSEPIAQPASSRPPASEVHDKIKLLITNLINMPNSNRPDFSNGLEPNSKNLFFNSMPLKFDLGKSGNMEIEDSEQTNNSLDQGRQKASTSTAAAMEGLGQNKEVLKKATARTFGGLSNNQDYIRPKPKNPSLIK